MSALLLDANGMKRTLSRLAHEILEANSGAAELVAIGILRRGYPVAKRLAFLMTQVEGVTIPCGKLDARSFRDDASGDVDDESDIPFQVNGKHVILVDEVIYTGRTIRSALDSVIQLGRPASVQLAVLIDRGHRELPIQPDFVGKKVETDGQDYVMVKVHEIDGEDSVELLSPAEVNH